MTIEIFVFGLVFAFDFQYSYVGKSEKNKI